MNGGYIPAGGGGGGVAWGAITGTLSAQTDLETALDAKSPAILPQWQYSASGPGGGQFLPNNTPANSTSIQFSSTDLNGFGSFGFTSIIGGILCLTNGVSREIFSVSANTSGTLSVAALSTSGNPWSGVYTITSFVPFSGLMVDDTGWTANADTGDKTQSIPSSATLATVQAALNLAVPGAGDALFALAQKCKALETALAANLLPNV